MKISKMSLTVCLLLTAILGGMSVALVSADDNMMTDQQIVRIRDNCLSAKNTLNQLHASDALLRVNRGQIYESMSTKLMSGFNGRVSSNRHDNSGLVSIKNGYDLKLNTFRSDYKTYEEHLSAAINIDCKKQPVAFYDAVATARNERVSVHDDIVRLNQYIDEYQLAVSQFGIDLQVPVGGIGN